MEKKLDKWVFGGDYMELKALIVAIGGVLLIIVIGFGALFGWYLLHFVADDLGISPLTALILLIVLWGRK